MRLGKNKNRKIDKGKEVRDKKMPNMCFTTICVLCVGEKEEKRSSFISSVYRCTLIDEAVTDPISGTVYR